MEKPIMRDAPGGVSQITGPSRRLPETMLVPTQKFGPVAGRHATSFQVPTRDDIAMLLMTASEADGSVRAIYSEGDAQTLRALGAQLMRAADAIDAAAVPQGGVQ